MGFFDGFIHVVNAIGHAAEAALAGARHLAEEAAKQIQEAAHEAEAIAQHVRSKITDSATDMEHQLSALKPNFDEKMQDIVDEVSNVARSAADQGVDISEAIDAAIELAVKNVETALKAAIDAVNQFLFEAKEKLFGFLHELLPGWLQFALGPLEALAGLALEGLKKFGGLLKDGIGFVLDKIKKAAKALARKIGEVLGPIWGFLKELWKMLFGTEPEHCEMAAQWFEERMKKIERELLCTHQAEPITAVIFKRTFTEVLPPDPQSWKSLVKEYINREGSIGALREQTSTLTKTLEDTNTSPGALTQLVWDVPYTDSLGGRSRVQIAVLYFRWRTEEFRTVSAGMLRILAMVSVVSTNPPVQTSHVEHQVQDTLLPVDLITMQQIYKEITPYLYRGQVLENGAYGKPEKIGGKKMKHISRQLRWKDENGIWRVAEA